MEHHALTTVALFIIGFGLISRRIGTTPLTAPMAFVAFGLLMGGMGLDFIELSPENPLVHLLAELTLVLILFTDAARIDLKSLREDHDIPVRMLAFGLPLTMVLGAVAALIFFPEMPIWEALILAVILAPTDAALGQVVVSSTLVPVRIRQALNVESGLNDGIALPILLLFICLAMGSSGTHEAENWPQLAAMQLTLGPIVGILVGLIGGRLVLWAQRKEWINESFLDLSSLGLALLSFAAAESVGGNGFLAAFCAGLTLGNTARGLCDCIYEFAEAEGQLLTLITFMLFGAIMAPDALAHFQWSMLGYALVSLTLVRLIPVALSLIGLKLKGRTTVFLGWFGPRGIASILYGLLVLEEKGIAGRDTLFTITVVTVLVSVFAHGLTAWPGVKWYSTDLGTTRSPEHDVVPEMPIRHS